MTIEMAFGQVLKKYRKKRKVTQEDLALECDLDRTYISMLERGLKNPTLKTIFLVTEALEVRIEVFIEEVSKVYTAISDEKFNI